MSLPIDLPAISIPEIPLPLEIPELIHPAIVHFAIAIPVVIFLLEIYNLAAKRRTISAFSLFLLIVVAIMMFGAYVTGGVDGKATWDILSTEAQGELKEHKLLGIYLVYGSLALVVLKLLFMAIRKTIGRVLFIVILGGFIAATLFQGKEGGELVYKHGANIEKVVEMSSDGDDAKEELEEAEEKLSELQEKYDALLEESKESKESKEAEESTEVETAKEETPVVVEDEKKEESESNETTPSSETNSSN